MPTMSYRTFNPSCHGSTFNMTRLKRDSEFDIDFSGFNFHIPNHGPCASPAIRRRKKMTRARIEGKHYNFPPRNVMQIINRAKHAIPLFIAIVLLAGVPAFAQVDFTGVWNPRVGDEDNPERLAGPSLVEYVGLPINDYARQWALAYSPARLGLPAHQWHVHEVADIHARPRANRIED